MDCLFSILQLCLFDPSGVYLNSQLSWQVSGDHGYYDGQSYTPSNPSQGRIGIGVEIPVSKSFRLTYGIEHLSYAAMSDRGEERAFVGFAWKPFR